MECAKGGNIVDTERVYTCAGCGKQFTKKDDWSDEKADAEYAARFEEFAVAGASRRLVCADCYRKIVGKDKP